MTHTHHRFDAHFSRTYSPRVLLVVLLVFSSCSSRALYFKRPQYYWEPLKKFSRTYSPRINSNTTRIQLVFSSHSSRALFLLFYYSDSTRDTARVHYICIFIRSIRWWCRWWCWWLRAAEKRLSYFVSYVSGVL
jgi:hypothetical protein